MSLRAELVRLGLRWFVKRKIGPATTLEALRRQDAFLERLVPPPPKGAQATHIDLATPRKAVRVWTHCGLREHFIGLAYRPYSRPRDGSVVSSPIA